MSRTRMLSDSFWDDPDQIDYTAEMRLMMVMLLTSRFSNIVGIYRVNWRSFGAATGWTPEQTINVIAHIQGLDGCRVDVDTGWIWVIDWWKHNSIRAALTGNVAKKARLELEAVPPIWHDDVIKWLIKNDVDASCTSLIWALEGAYKGLDSPIEGAGATTNPNSTYIDTTNPTTIQTIVFPRFLSDIQRQTILANHGSHPDLQIALDELSATNSSKQVTSPLAWLGSVLASGVNKTDRGLKAAEVRLQNIQS